MRFDCKEDIIQLTPLWKGERFEDGRPRVPDDVVRRMAAVNTEEAWGTLWGKDYKYQFQGDFRIMHADRILVGRAVTAVFVPRRPDLNDTLLEYGQKQEGRIGFFNHWVIETMVEDDVLVVDIFDKVYEGTVVGGNLSTAVATRGKRGQVIWGGIRDVQQVLEIPSFQTFYRGNDPTPIRDVTLTGLNVPCRIGNATCMPGDIVLGTPSGVMFVPPHLAEEVVVRSEKTRLREMFGLQKVREGVYRTDEVDRAWTPEMEAAFTAWRQENTPEEYRHLVWDEEPKKPAKDQGPTLL